MADRAGDDLFDRGLAARQSRRVIFRRQIADQRGNAALLAKARQQLFKKQSLAGTGTRHQADDIDARFVKSLAQGAREQVILLQNFLSDLDQTRRRVHDSTSRATTSSSRPRTTSGVGLSQTEQQNRWTESSCRSARQTGQ